MHPWLATSLAFYLQVSFVKLLTRKVRWVSPALGRCLVCCSLFLSYSCTPQHRSFCRGATYPQTWTETWYRDPNTSDFTTCKTPNSQAFPRWRQHVGCRSRTWRRNISACCCSRSQTGRKSTLIHLCCRSNFLSLSFVFDPKFLQIVAQWGEEDGPVWSSSFFC